MALTQSQVTANLGSGWTLGSGTTVTSSNQEDFAVAAESSCGLVAAADKLSSGEYAPKVGWIVYDVTKSDGSMDIIWHNDDGAGNVTNFNLSDCVGTMSSGGAGGSGGGSVIKKLYTGSSFSTFLLLGGLAVGAYYLLAGKGKKSSSRKVSRRKGRA
jgi:hypothetical protein